MKRHLTAAKVSHRGRGERGTGRDGEDHQHLGLPSRPATPDEPRPAVKLRSVRPRAHTLKLTGELHLRSGPMLEEELERLFSDGVTSITLDLSELSYIDPIGVALIAFRCGLAERRGYDLRVIAGSQLMHSTLEKAGVQDLAPLQGDQAGEATPIAPAATQKTSRNRRRRRLLRTIPTAARSSRSSGLGGL